MRCSGDGIEFQSPFVRFDGRGRFAFPFIKVGEFFSQHGAVGGGVEVFQIICHPEDGRAVGERQINDAQTRPFDQRAVAALQLRVQKLQRFAERPVKRVTDDRGLPGQDRLRRPGGLAEGKTVAPSSAPERRQCLACR